MPKQMLMFIFGAFLLWFDHKSVGRSFCFKELLFPLLNLTPGGDSP